MTSENYSHYNKYKCATLGFQARKLYLTLVFETDLPFFADRNVHVKIEHDRFKLSVNQGAFNNFDHGYPLPLKNLSTFNTNQFCSSLLENW